jgi:hypothetical protein
MLSLQKDKTKSLERFSLLHKVYMHIEKKSHFEKQKEKIFY